MSLSSTETDDWPYLMFGIMKTFLPPLFTTSFCRHLLMGLVGNQWIWRASIVLKHLDTHIASPKVFPQQVWLAANLCKPTGSQSVVVSSRNLFQTVEKRERTHLKGIEHGKWCLRHLCIVRKWVVWQKFLRPWILIYIYICLWSYRDRRSWEHTMRLFVQESSLAVSCCWSSLDKDSPVVKLRMCFESFVQPLRWVIPEHLWVWNISSCLVAQVCCCQLAILSPSSIVHGPVVSLAILNVTTAMIFVWVWKLHVSSGTFISKRIHVQVKMSEECSLSGRQVLGVGKVDMSHLSSTEKIGRVLQMQFYHPFLQTYRHLCMLWTSCWGGDKSLWSVAQRFYLQVPLKQNRICPFEHTKHFEHGTWQLSLFGVRA